MSISVQDKNYALYKSISEDFETGWTDFEKLEEEFGFTFYAKYITDAHVAFRRMQRQILNIAL